MARWPHRSPAWRHRAAALGARGAVASRAAAPLTAAVSSGVLPHPLTAGYWWSSSAHLAVAQEARRQGSAEPRGGRLVRQEPRTLRVATGDVLAAGCSNPGPRPTVSGSLAQHSAPPTPLPPPPPCHPPSVVLLPGRAYSYSCKSRACRCGSASNAAGASSAAAALP